MEQSVTENNKRIAKNTMLLYLRMIVVTILSFVTIKYTLNILGQDDYGIYNLVAGAVSFLSFLTVTISSATQRFLAFELGRGDKRRYNDTFNMLLLLFVSLSILTLVIFEVLAYPLIYDWLNIPDLRRGAAMMVYQVSVVAFIASVLAIPFISSILANEKMGVYAYIAVADTIAKLLLLAILFLSPYDKLLSYSVGTMLIAIATNSIYYFYNAKMIPDTGIYFYWDRSMFRSLMGYTGWSFFGSISAVMCNQGLSILMNFFFGVGVNAAKGVTDRIKGVVQSFVSNFYMAVNPQIIKTYAAKNYDYTVMLAFSSTRLAYYLLLILCVPIMLLLEDILRLWLAEDYTTDILIFTQLSLVFTLVNAFEAPMSFMMRATGNIKKYQICVGTLTLLILPVSCLLYLLGFPAYAAFWCEIIIYAAVQMIRVKIVSGYYPITIKKYAKDVLARPLMITAIIVVGSYLLSYSGMGNILTTSVMFPLLLLLIWSVGLMANERQMVIDRISRLKKTKKG